MPHKHTRRDHDPASFDLPPSQIARPLPVQQRSRKALAAAAKNSKNGKNPKTENDGIKKRKGRSKDDDAPRAFKRMMALASGKKQRSGLDNGETVNQKKKAAKKAASVAEKKDESSENAEKSEVPTIRPGEKMSDFSARVNAALPLAGLVNKTERGGKDPLGLKVHKTRKERKMHKLYDQWREEERKIQEQREEDMEEVAERELDEEINGGTFGNFGQTPAAFYGSNQDGKKKKKKGKKGKGADREEDPWAVLKKMRAEAKVGLHDVAQAPPELHRAGREKLLVRGAAVDVSNVPKSAGSLRRREELQELRDELVSSYRRKREEKLARLAAETSASAS
ncbi:hypothetical protein CSHISOI_00938 [Colletotrichum shisoi]|uniref:Urease accessory protein n=1 Tax=Colletotrichum shisoi TaxID=2078593 RepID=A0A5Q4C6L0_9PEZI|nr:hypothetical protein CSHISOI_00938 [Colletotrichum shisoi]